MKLVIGSDKSGFFLKEAIKKYLDEADIKYDDLGTQSVDSPKPFFEVADKVAPLVGSGKYEKGILICGTGMGMSIVSNKYKGVYAAAVEKVYSAKMCRAINNANILCMGGWLIGEILGVEMTKAFLNTQFGQDLEDWRQAFLVNAEKKVKEIEDKIYE